MNGPMVIERNTLPDLIEWLPKGAADKLRALRQCAADMHALMPEFEDRKAASEAKIKAEDRLRRLTAHPQDAGFHLPDTDGRVIAARKELARLTAEAKRLNDRYNTRVGAWRNASSLVQTVETWLRDGRPGAGMLSRSSS